MNLSEAAGLVAIAWLVVREAFAFVKARNGRNRNNPGGHSSPETAARFDGIEGHLTAIDMELVRIRDRQHELGNALALLKGQWEMMKREREP